MLTPIEVQAIISRLDFIKSHSPQCQRQNHIKRYDTLKRKTCTCKYYSCGVHAPGEGYRRKPTGQITLEKAQEIVRRRIESSNPKLGLEPNAISIETATEDFLSTVQSKERSSATFIKYKTLTDQLASFCRWKGIASIRSFDQSAMQQFFDSWSDKNAAYKQGTKWTAMNRGTCKRNLKTMRLLFRRCLKRKWMTEDPSTVIEIAPEATKKTRDQVKYLTEAQMGVLIAAMDDNFHQMTEYNKLRLKALMLLMRWTGLRISDAVKVRQADIRADVLFVITKKTKTPLQIPLPPVLMSLLNQLRPYDGDYLFWNRRSEESDIKTAEHNFGQAISHVFDKAELKENVRHISHRFRNTFAVHLLTNGVPLETVSLMLGHQNIHTTENYYADYAKGYMDRAEKMLRESWEGEPLK